MNMKPILDKIRKEYDKDAIDLISLYLENGDDDRWVLLISGPKFLPKREDFDCAVENVKKVLNGNAFSLVKRVEVYNSNHKLIKNLKEYLKSFPNQDPNALMTINGFGVDDGYFEYT